jgi:hypothetical protein
MLYCKKQVSPQDTGRRFQGNLGWLALDNLEIVRSEHIERAGEPTDD